MTLGRFRFKVSLAPHWFLGYQKYGDMCGTEWVDVFIIPGVVVRFGYHWIT